MTFAEILEEWAELYKPISHNPDKGSKQRAFYLIKAINMDNAFMRAQNTAKSPCMAYSIIIDAEVQNHVVNYQHIVYFMSRATQRSLAKNAKSDEDLGIDQQQLMDGFAQDLLAYLTELKRTGKNPVTGRIYDKLTQLALQGLQIEKCSWASNPGVVRYGEWHLLGLKIEQNVPISRCINKEKYLVPEGKSDGKENIKD